MKKREKYNFSLAGVLAAEFEWLAKGGSYGKGMLCDAAMLMLMEAPLPQFNAYMKRVGAAESSGLYEDLIPAFKRLRGERIREWEAEASRISKMMAHDDPNTNGTATPTHVIGEDLDVTPLPQKKRRGGKK